MNEFQPIRKLVRETFGCQPISSWRLSRPLNLSLYCVFFRLAFNFGESSFLEPLFHNVYSVDFDWIVAFGAQRNLRASWRKIPCEKWVSWSISFKLHVNMEFFSVGWGANSQVQGFGEPPTMKHQMLNLVRSIRTVAKSEFFFFVYFVSKGVPFQFLSSFWMSLR